MTPEVFFGIAVFALGAYVGACADRVCYWIHVSRTLVWRVHCVACFSPHTWSTYVPVFGRLMHRGACVSCKQPLPLRPLIVEILGATTMWVLWYFRFAGMIPYGVGEWALFSAYTVLVWGFLTLFISDLAYDELPVYVYALTFLVLMGTLLSQFSVADVFVNLFAGFVAGILMLLLLILSDWKWVHGHDVLIAVLMGTLVGLPAIFVTLALTYVCAIIGALVGVLWKGTRMRGASFFGVYLFVALCIQGLLAALASWAAV